MDAKMSANWYICSIRVAPEIVGGEALVVLVATFSVVVVPAVALGTAGVSIAPLTAFDLDLIDISSETDNKSA
jgi:hypothetical protein